MKGKIFFTSFSLITITIANFLISTSIGPVHIPINSILLVIYEKLFNMNYSWTIFTIVFYIRMPRVILALLVGSILALSGLVAQTIFRNPLGDPYLTGVASGAALGAAIGFLVSPFLVTPLAFIFAMIAVAISFTISRTDGEVKAEILILSGISISFLFSAVASYLIYLKVYNLRGVIFWLLGGLYGANWNEDFWLFIAVVIIFPILIYFTRELDIILLGDDEAKSLGVNTAKVKTIVIVLSSLITSFAVSLTGIIGFIGLVSPHIGRKIFGESHRFLIVSAPLIGANLLLVSDTIARSSPQGEIPVGIITSFIGSPLLIYLLFKRRKL